LRIRAFISTSILVGIGISLPRWTAAVMASESSVVDCTCFPDLERKPMMLQLLVLLGNENAVKLRDCTLKEIKENIEEIMGVYQRKLPAKLFPFVYISFDVRTFPGGL
jgi:hypothetical protein